MRCAVAPNTRMRTDIYFELSARKRDVSREADKQAPREVQPADCRVECTVPRRDCAVRMYGTCSLVVWWCMRKESERTTSERIQGVGSTRTQKRDRGGRGSRREE